MPVAVALLVTAYAAVLLGELAGDRLLYTVGALASRYRPTVVALGVMPALMGKALAAVLLGRVIARLPGPAVAAMTAATFAATALALWRRAPSTAARAVPAPMEPTGRGVAVAFGAVFFTEWGDVGQLTTAALTARYDAPTLVWLAASMALATKGALALALGIGLRRYAPRPLVRRTSIALCVVMGVLAIVHPDR